MVRLSNIQLRDGGGGLQRVTPLNVFKNKLYSLQLLRPTQNSIVTKITAHRTYSCAGMQALQGT